MSELLVIPDFVKVLILVFMVLVLALLIGLDTEDPWVKRWKFRIRMEIRYVKKHYRGVHRRNHLQATFARLICDLKEETGSSGITVFTPNKEIDVWIYLYEQIKLNKGRD